MAFSRAEEMIFGTVIKPVETKRGLKIGGGCVIPEVVPHPRSGSERNVKTLLREFERANGDVLERCVTVGPPCVVIENEHVFQMTHAPQWGEEIAMQTAPQMDEYKKMTRLAIAMDLGTSGFRVQAMDLSSGDIISTAISKRHPLPGVNVMDQLHFAMELGVQVAHDLSCSER